MCVKPLINLFNGENHSKVYRHFLSNVANFKNQETFTASIEDCIVQLEKYNLEAVNRKPDDIN